MKKYPCEIIEDLIPLYIEEDVNNTTKEIIENHLRECERCSLLVQEYSVNELDIDEITKDLPQVDTFKNLMKRLKIWVAGAGILAIIIVIAVGAFGYKIGEKSNDNVLTLKTVVKTFKAHGLSLKENKSIPLKDYILEGVKPRIYNLEDDKDQLFIYVFESFGERKQILLETDRFNNPFSFDEFSFKAKNILMVLAPTKAIETEEDIERVSQKLKIIKELTFKDLNEGQERIYTGESANWKGSIVLKHYEHWFHDDGTLRLNSFYESQPSIKYKKDNPESIGSISYEYKLANSRSYGSGNQVNQEGYLEIASIGGSGMVPDEDEEIIFIIKWREQEEEIIFEVDKKVQMTN